MYEDACQKFYKALRNGNVKRMSLDEYAQRRHSLHIRKPRLNPELTQDERLAIISQARNFPKLGLTYERNKFGVITNVYYLR